MPMLGEKIEKNPKFSFSEVKSFLWEVVKVVVISLAIVIPVRHYLIQPFYVKGASMEPNLYDHEYLVINEIGYRFYEPQRGDIVVFRYPYDLSEYFIKRIIGLPGERVKIENDQVNIYNAKYPDGVQLDESSYLPAGIVTSGNIDVTLGQEEYFVMGDNRTSSLDSRSFGSVPGKDIVGRTWIRGWPLNRISAFKTPSYGL